MLPNVNKYVLAFIKKNPTRCNNVLKFYYSVFICSSTCFGRHAAHFQEPKIALAASGFAYVEGCWTCSWWTLSGTVCAWQPPPNFHVWKTRGCQCSFRLLMMGGVWPRNTLSFIQIRNNKILIHCCILLDFSLWIFVWCTDPRTSSLVRAYQNYDTLINIK